MLKEKKVHIVRPPFPLSQAKRIWKLLEEMESAA